MPDLAGIHIPGIPRAYIVDQELTQDTSTQKTEAIPVGVFMVRRENSGNSCCASQAVS